MKARRVRSAERAARKSNPSIRLRKSVSFYYSSLVFGNLVVVIPADHRYFLATHRPLLHRPRYKERSLIRALLVQNSLSLGGRDKLQPQERRIRILGGVQNTLGFVEAHGNRFYELVSDKFGRVVSPTNTNEILSEVQLVL